MGLIISKFRKQKSTIEVLEEIDKNIATHQRFKRQNQEYQKKFIASLILYSIIAYVVVVVVFFICYFPQSWQDWLFASIPLLLFPVLIWLVKKLMHWYFVKRISSNELALQELRDKKKDILEDVMETETYKKAKEILEKFDPARFKELEIKPLERKPATDSESDYEDEVEPLPEDKTAKQDDKVVRQRIVTTRTMSPVMRMPNPVQPMSAPHPHQRNPNPSIGSPMQMVSQMNGRQMPIVHPGYGRSPGPPMPRPVPPRERKNLDKFIDYLVGEGPQNRYALICRYCHSHNGMAMKEEFEYISFRCCYCYHLNPAKKQRPHAPRLDFPTPQSSPARKAIAAPDSKITEEKGSSEEEDNVSTSSKKSEDLETEKTDNELSDDAGGAEASESAAKPVESVKDADDIPMADEDGTEEEEKAADEGEEQVKDGMGSEIVKDDSAGTQDIVEASIAAANEPQAEATTESQEHKTKKEEDVVSELITKETAPLTSAEKPEEPEESMETTPLETTKDAPIVTEAAAREAELSAEILKITQEALPIADEIPMPEEASVTVDTAAKDALIDTATEEVSETAETSAEDVLTQPLTKEITEEAPVAEEVSVTTETNTQPIAEDLLMTADIVAEEIADQAIKEALTIAETEVAPIATNTTIVEPSILAGSSAQHIVEDLVTTEATAATEKVSMTADNAAKEDIVTAEVVSKQMAEPVPAVEEIPEFVEPDVQQVAEAALADTVPVAEELLIPGEVSGTADTEIGEVPMSADTDVKQIAMDSETKESPKCTVEDPEILKSTVLVEEPQVVADEGEFVEKENIEELVELDEYEMITEVVDDEAVVPQSIAGSGSNCEIKKEEAEAGAVKGNVDVAIEPIGNEKKTEVSHLPTTGDSEPLMK